MTRALWIADVLRDAGLEIHEIAGWQTRGSTRFDPVAVMWHHTATKPTTDDAVVDRMLAVRGSSLVPPPLCNYSTNRDGTISIIAAGAANHAGIGEWHGLKGNRFFVGDEMKNTGTKTEPWSPIQLESARIAAAAVLRHLSTDALWLCGHKEYAKPTGRKPDPHTLEMNLERQKVQAIIAPPPLGENVLPLTRGQDSEDVRLLKVRLNDVYGAGLNLQSTIYDDQTVAAVKDHLGRFTGNPDGKEGRLVNARMWEGLLVGLIDSRVD